MRLLLLGLSLLLFLGCTNDPYDPLLGPRNPRPGAEKYLAIRNDIPEAQKKALLNSEPCTRETLQALVDAPAREVRSLVAANFSADEAILEKLTHDKETGVRQYVAANPKAPKAILLKLQNDANENVKWSLERNPNWKKSAPTEKPAD